MSLIWFVFGWFVGFFMTRRYYTGLKQKVTIHMNATEATNFLESEEAVRLLKEEMKIK
jgi:cytosine/uracil/thiamine/allantoin permease